MKSLNNGSDDSTKLDKKSSIVDMVGQRDRRRGELSRNERGWKKGRDSCISQEIVIEETAKVEIGGHGRVRSFAIK